MSSQSARNLSSAGFTRLAGWLFALTGVLTGAVFAYWMTGSDPKTNPKAFADALTGVGGIGAGFVYVAALIGLLLGIVALYATLARGEVDQLSLVGLVASVFGIGMLIAAQGASIFGGAVVARSYLDGNAGAADVMVKFNGGSFGQAIIIAYGVASVLGAIGGLLFGIAVWKSGTLPRWTGVVFGAGLFLLIITVPFLSQVGEILLVVAGIQIARTGSSGATDTRSELAHTA